MRKKTKLFGFIIIGILLTGFLVKVFVFDQKKQGLYAGEIDKNIIYSDIKKDLGIVLDSFRIEYSRVRRNQNLADILYGLEKPVIQVEKAINSAKNVFDLTNIRAGNEYRIYNYIDSIENPYYFVYKHSSTEYLKIRLHKEPVAEFIEKEIVAKRKTGEGTIVASLWETMLENEMNPVIANELSEIYAWTIDFFGLEKGDKFKLIYDELYVDSIPVDIGRIYAASFTHKGEQMLSFYFEQDSVPGYFNEDGISLRRQFLKAPLRFSRISSGYSHSRFHPILKIYRPHTGVDYAAPTGTPIHAVGDGNVIKKGYTKGAGYYIKIKHNSVYTTGYNHLSRYGKGMRVGKRVKQGDIIGYVGSTGYATGPHLDFRFWKNGHAVNPLKIDAPPVEPIKEENKEEFKKFIQPLIEELQAI